jgi:CBS domain-containing protein
MLVVRKSTSGVVGNTMMGKAEPGSFVDFVESVMVSHVETVKPTVLLEYVLKKIVRKNIGCVVVVEGGKPVGIITERDVSRKVAKSTKILKTKVSQVMSSPVIAVTPRTPVDKAVYLMLKHGIRRLPVIEEGELVGLISERDLLRWVLQISYEPQIPIEIKRILARRAEAKS